MDKRNILEALQPERLKTWLKTAFAEVGITTEELLKDDRKVEKAALIAWEKIPLIPYRAVIKVTIGKDGFTKLLFNVRDKMLESKSIDFSWLSPDYLKSILPKLQRGI